MQARPARAAALALVLLSTTTALGAAAPAAGTTELISRSSAGERARHGPSGLPAVSGDGRFVAFQSRAANLVPGDTNGATDVFVRDRLLGTTTRVSVASDGGQAAGSSFSPSISADGRRVAFVSGA